MSLLFLVISLIVCLITSTTQSQPSTDFIFNGFQSTNLNLDGEAKNIDGILFLTNRTQQTSGHAFYPSPIIFKNSTNDSAISFSTSFVFGIIPDNQTGGHGLCFVIAPEPGLPGAKSNSYMGLFNKSTMNPNRTNHILAVEFDTVQSPEFEDIDNNHVGIDIDSLESVYSKHTAYNSDNNGTFQNMSLISDESRRVWIEYDGVKKQMNVTVAPINLGKPFLPLLTLNKDLSQYINPIMYVGFSSSTGTIFNRHYLLGWSFKLNGQAKELDLSLLPKLPTNNNTSPTKSSKFPKRKFLIIGMPSILGFVLLITIISALVYYFKRKKKFAEEMEDWELEYGPHRFKYKDLYFATNGFSNKELLGTGGFGQVYRGILPSSKMEVAVKRMSQESWQGMREFVAEIVSIGRLRHRNLVQLIGYCRRKKELLLVYEYMSGGSLEKLLYNISGPTLNWSQRFTIIKGVASGLFYLHEGWEQVVIHRDVKASNVLLDNELNGKLGDFGLARLHDHGSDPHTTQVVGTLGYLAPEQMWTGKVTEATDVFAFGAFLLEVACGRRPIEMKQERFILIEWVFRFWLKGLITNAVDPNLGGEFDFEEVELVIKLGLLCSNMNPSARPTMRQVVEYLERDVIMPELSSFGITISSVTFPHREGINDDLYPSTSSFNPTYDTSIMAESQLSQGR
ncbi:L-type lectin-domain containing receptor kinase IV.1-like [Impatiens glandulifera]|uniref:L-type lectin-domain containing receptor kinase IV.1-like n=1 Tax=Impatiens glandulifera TaxID=253017 RepID=UPI001FB0A78E|nr:L-type lectin-domain containing receptor kinase IV.1-like [Impatiens glandulifera]